MSIKSILAPSDIKLEDYIAVVVPCGKAPDRMQLNKGSTKLAKYANSEGEDVAAIFQGARS